MDREEYLRRVKSHIKTPMKDMEQQLNDFCSICTYVSGQYDKDEPFVELRKHIEEFEKGRKEANRIFYMALPPSVFTTVSQHLKKNCYPQNGIARIVVWLIPSILVDFTLTRVFIGRKTLRKGSCKLQRAAEGLGTKLEGGGDFPYRPLSRKGNGQKHFDSPIW
jgi:hypothetical protein